MQTIQTVSQCYECEICRGINHAKRFHCQFCNTIPRFYSWLNAPILDYRPDGIYIAPVITVFVAFGAIRQTSTRTIRRVMRTVRADYYAQA